jgi:phenylacetate-CoA ligase
MEIETAATVPVADSYGSREGGFVAQQCPHGSYHVTMESIIVELLDGNGREVANDASGEIVLTHLDAIGMPLIRYRTGDLARWGRESCPCGRGLVSLRDIAGRRTDVVRRQDGGSAHALSLIYVLRDAPGVRQFRISQRADLSLDVEIVANRAFDDMQRKRAASMLGRQVGAGIDVRFNPVERIPATASGKHRHVESQAI